MTSTQTTMDREPDRLRTILDEAKETGIIISTFDVREKDIRQISDFSVRRALKMSTRDVGRDPIYVRRSTFHPWEQVANRWERQLSKLELWSSVTLPRNQWTNQVVGQLLLAADTVKGIRKKEYKTIWGVTFEGEAANKVLDVWLENLRINPEMRKALAPRAPRRPRARREVTA